MATASSEMSRVNFNPDWMNSAFPPSMPARFSSSGGGSSSNLQQQQQNQQNINPNSNDTVLAPPKLSKNRYGREELLALFTGNEAAPPPRLKSDFADFYLPFAQEPICYLPFTEIEQRLLVQGGINSSKVINAVNHADRQQRFSQVPPPAAPRGFGRGDPAPFPRGRPMDLGQGPPPPNRFPGGVGRGRGDAPRGGFRQVGGMNIGGGMVHAPNGPSPMRDPSTRSSQQEDWVAPPPQNTRAQGLYDPNNPRDRPRQRLKSSSKPEEAEDAANMAGGGGGIPGGAAGFVRSQRRTKSVSSQDQNVPEWAKDDDEEDESLGTFDATGNFRPGQIIENSVKVLAAPAQQTNPVVDKPLPEGLASKDNNDQRAVDRILKAPTPKAEESSAAVARRVPQAFGQPLTEVPRAMTKSAASLQQQPPQQSLQQQLKDVSSGKMDPKSFIEAMRAAPKPTFIDNASPAPVRHAAPIPFGQQRTSEASLGGQQLKTTDVLAAPLASREQRHVSSDDVLQKLHQQAEHIVHSVCVEDDSMNRRTTTTMEMNGDENVLWVYQDPSGQSQGPFDNNQMHAWFHAGYFTMQLMIRRASETNFMTLGDLIKRCGHKIPFVSKTNSVSPTPHVASSPMLVGVEMPSNVGAGAALGAFSNTGASFNQPSTNTGQIPTTRSVWDLDPKPALATPKYADSVASLFSSISTAPPVTSAGPPPSTGAGTSTQLDHGSLQAMIERYARQQEEERRQLEEEQKRRLEEEQRKFVQMQEQIRREKEENERKMREIEEQKRRNEEMRLREEMAQRQKAEKELEEKRAAAAQQKRLEELNKKAAAALAEEKKRRADEEERLKKMREMKEKDEKEVRRLEEERRKEAQRQKNINAEKASAMAAWSKSQEKGSGAQSLKEIQLEEERQMVAERRQQLEQELQLKKEVFDAPTVAAGAWGSTTSTKTISWDKPAAASGAGKSAWATPAGDSSIQGFWDDEPSLTAPSSKKSNAQDKKKSTKQQNNPTSGRNQTITAQVQPKTTKAENNVKRLFAASANQNDEFFMWCVKQVKKFNAIDQGEASVFVNFLVELPDSEVEDYIFSYFGESSPSKEFLKNFLDRRGALKRAKSKSTTIDDLAAPAVALMPTLEKEAAAAATNATTAQQAAKKKNKKGAGGVGSKRALDTSILLGFKATSDPNRVNAGEIDSPTL